MSTLTDEEIWNKVKQLEGETLNTYIEHEENQIIKVEDTGSSLDGVIIKDRQTTPIREDIIAAYRLLFKKGDLKRKSDLAWLAGPEKKTSSIVFRIVGEIAFDKAEFNSSGDPKIIVKR